MDKAKVKIKNIVNNYKTIYPEEYQNFLVAIKQRQLDSFNDNKYREIKGDGIVQRFLVEKPTKLHTMIKIILEPDEYDWFETKTGVRWFAKTFREFKAADKL